MGNIFDCAQNPLNALPEEGDGAVGDAPHAHSIPFQEATRLRDSIIWELQRGFYDKVNIRAWSEAIVPHFVTSNSYIGKAYAKVLIGLMKDVFEARGGALAGADPSEPIYIVEIGAGHGKFSYLVVETLMRFKDFLPRTTRSRGSSKEPGEETKEGVDEKASGGAGAGAGGAGGATAAGGFDDSALPPFVYVMTDFTQANVEFWKAHPSLQPFVRMGVLDFAVFNAETDDSIRLQVSGKVLSPETVKNPMVTICNYIFDTLTTDAFRVEKKVLKQAKLALSTAQEEKDTSSPEIISRLRFAWSYEDVDPASDLFGDEDLNNLVREYAARHEDASILIPVGGIRLCRTLLRISNNRLLLLTGDKGYNYEDELTGLRHPHIAQHGSFSFMVNFHALKMFFDDKGGFSMHTPHLDGFKCSAFFVGGEPGEFCQSRWAFQDGVQDFAPENFSTLQRCLKEECRTPSLKLVLSLLRLGFHDTDVFYKFKQVLIDKIAHPPPTEMVQADVRLDVSHIESAYYPLQASKDVCFELGRLLMGLKDYASAVEFFKRSNEACGEHHVTWHNMGICYYYIDSLSNSIKCFRHSLTLKRDYKEAHDWLAKVSGKAQRPPLSEEEYSTDSDEDDEDDEE